MARPLIAALVVAGLGFAFVWQGFTNPAGLCGHLAPHGQWYWDGHGAFPPGAQGCHRHLPGGEVEHTTVYPWGDWMTVLVMATSAGLFVAALRAPRRRIVRASGAYVLFLAAAFGWFVSHPLVWAALAAAAIAAVLHARRWTPPPPHRGAPLAS